MQLNVVVQAVLAVGLIIITFGIWLSLTRQDFLNASGTEHHCSSGLRHRLQVYRSPPTILSCCSIWLLNTRWV
jgi:hypothetical protein